MQISRREIGVWGVVFVETADRGIAKDYTAASVGLQPVFVRVDDDRIGLANCAESLDRVRGEAGDEFEIATVGGVDVEAESILFTQRNNPLQRIDGADGGGAERGDDGPNVSLLQLGFQRIEVHSSAPVDG